MQTAIVDDIVEEIFRRFGGFRADTGSKMDPTIIAASALKAIPCEFVDQVLTWVRQRSLA